MSEYQRLKNVLIVEDNLSIQKLLKDYLEGLEIQAMAVSDGEQAIQILSHTPVDLLITDFRMPKIDGVELLNWCRSHNIHCPVIFMSAQADLVQREQIALADCCATLMFKPFNLDVFQSAIGAADSRNHHKDCIHFRTSPVSG